ncbi:MAG: hypothetical protein H0U54_15725, partial [Acidobacteria bacterium]|nr:hypothetical protein [Acidobacteriota bacterium]
MLENERCAYMMAQSEKGISMSKGNGKKNSGEGKQQGNNVKVNDLSKVTEDGSGEFLTTN